jgi:hypothetical protein
MKKFIQENFTIIALVFMVLVLFKSCGDSREIAKLRKDYDSLQVKIVTEDKMVNIIKATPNWKTLEIEELSDKNKTPINYFKNEQEKK